GRAISWDIAHHLYGLQRRGKIIIVAEQPLALLAATRKQWLKLMGQVRREQAGTLNTIHLIEIGSQLALMQSMAFTVKSQLEQPEADVFFCRYEQLLKVPPICHTLYIACGMEDDVFTELTNQLPWSGLVVVYGQ
ncbi:MAG TPA: hypothetical protein VLH38_02535, partial [Patescibacteria group bacterium]|nr:hypothetical protein [Patescibacteria group bacterium]